MSINNIRDTIRSSPHDYYTMLNDSLYSEVIRFELGDPKSFYSEVELTELNHYIKHNLKIDNFEFQGEMRMSLDNNYQAKISYLYEECAKINAETDSETVRKALIISGAKYKHLLKEFFIFNNSIGSKYSLYTKMIYFLLTFNGRESERTSYFKRSVHNPTTLMRNILEQRFCWEYRSIHEFIEARFNQEIAQTFLNSRIDEIEINESTDDLYKPKDIELNKPDERKIFRCEKDLHSNMIVIPKSISKDLLNLFDQSKIDEDGRMLNDPSFEFLKLSFMTKEEVLDNLEIFNEDEATAFDFVFMYNPNSKIEDYLFTKGKFSTPLKLYRLLVYNSLEKNILISKESESNHSWKDLLHQLEMQTAIESVDSRVAKLKNPYHRPHKEVHLQFGKYIYIPTIQVDKRELRSKLPAALYFGGFEVIPLTLESGDYILDEGVAIERKSADDLMSSLTNQRLGKQLSKMKQKFSHVYLLLEFNSRVEIQTLSRWSKGIYSRLSLYNNTKKTGRIKMNTANIVEMISNRYKGVNILWSFSPEQSVQYILHLKRKHN